ncbi:hypothetical protein [Kitasatospora sp. NPDC087314]|uniref:hypothetical protein n=1 Tax=Kitasatospora sp. NPDC087314 TaxID=3364068 RepID=UPI00382E0839
MREIGEQRGNDAQGQGEEAAEPHQLGGIVGCAVDPFVVRSARRLKGSAEELHGVTLGEHGKVVQPGVETSQNVPGRDESRDAAVGGQQRFDLFRSVGVVQHQQDAAALVRIRRQYRTVETGPTLHVGGHVLIGNAEGPQKEAHGAVRGDPACGPAAAVSDRGAGRSLSRA